MERSYLFPLNGKRTFADRCTRKVEPVRVIFWTPSAYLHIPVRCTPEDKENESELQPESPIGSWGVGKVWIRRY